MVPLVDYMNNRGKSVIVVGLASTNSSLGINYLLPAASLLYILQAHLIIDIGAHSMTSLNRKASQGCRYFRASQS